MENPVFGVWIWAELTRSLPTLALLSRVMSCADNFHLQVSSCVHFAACFAQCLFLEFDSCKKYSLGCIKHSGEEHQLQFEWNWIHVKTVCWPWSAKRCCFFFFFSQVSRVQGKKNQTKQKQNKNLKVVSTSWKWDQSLCRFHRVDLMTDSAQEPGVF